MKKISILAVMLMSAILIKAQTIAPYDSTRLLQKSSAIGTEIGNGKFKSSLGIPNDTVKMAVRDSNNIAIKDGIIYRWTGYVWSVAGGTGSGSLTNFSAGNLNPLFNSSVATSTTTPALSFSLQNTSQFTVFGRKTSGSGAPSYLYPDSSLIPDLHSESYYDTKYLGTGTPINLQSSTDAGNTTTNNMQITPGFGSWLDLGTSIGFGQTAGGYAGYLQRASLSGNRTWTLPDATGTIALTSQIPAQFNPIAGTNVTITGSYPNMTFNSAGGSVVVSDSAWSLTGNSISSGKFIGTTNNEDVVFKANNTEQFRALSSGGIQIPNSTGSTTGVIFKGSDRFIHSFALPGTATNLGQNLHIGVKAGNFTYTGSSGGFGTRNLSIGDSTLYANTTGYRNVAIGVWAGAANTTGFENTIVGANSHQNSTTGRQNTAIGAISLEQNTTGFRNTAVGFSSMQYGTTAERNVAIGGRAMQNVTTGFANAALGFDALAYNSTGDHNTAVGLDALYYSNGTHNTAVGDSTLWGLFNGPGLKHVGYKNVAIGSRAGYHLGDTYPNYASIFDTAVTFLGANASRDSSVAYTTSLKNMTVIGYNARGTASNQVTIGNSSVTQHVFYGALMPNNLPGTSGQVLTSAGANANPTWTTPTSGANTALSNLTSPTAFNQHALPGTDNSIDVGSGAKQWRYGIFGTGISVGAAATPLAALDIRAADIFLTSSAVDQRFIIGEGLVSADQLYAISWNRTDNQLVFNEGGAAVSMRLEGDASANLFFADATNDRIGIGTASPGSLFTVGANAFTVNSAGIVGAGTWNGTSIGTQYGGTGANNATNTSGSFLRSNGSNGNYVASTLILPNSATVNYIPYATSTNTWGQSSGLQYTGSELNVSGTGYFTEGVRINSYCISMTSESGTYGMNLAGQYLFYANSGSNELQFPDPGSLLGKEIIVKNKSGAALTYVGSYTPKNMAGTTDTQCPDGYIKRYIAQYDCDIDANVWHLIGRNDGTVD